MMSKAKLVIPIRWRIALGFACIVLPAILSYWAFAMQASATFAAFGDQPLSSKISQITESGSEVQLIERYRGYKRHLPLQGKIGFIYDERPLAGEYYMLQYVLSPLIVRSDANAPLVICQFRNAKKYAEVLRTKTLTSWVEVDYARPNGEKSTSTDIPRRVPMQKALRLKRVLGERAILFESTTFNMP